MSFLVTGAKFHFLEIISNATVIFLKKRYAAITPSVTHTLTPKRRAKGKFHYPTAGLFSENLKMKIKIFFSFRNCMK